MFVVASSCAPQPLCQPLLVVLLVLLQAPQGGAPSRREAMFGLLGAGLGVGLTTAFFKGTC